MFLRDYLELMAGEKRDRETAEQVKSFILANLQPVVPGGWSECRRTLVCQQ
jgi:hypothetical protein